jgi:uncharacterized protein (TIGR02246 family)
MRLSTGDAWGRTMTDRETIQALINQGYDARKTGDVEGIMALFHPDGKFELAGSKTHTAAAGIAQGHTALRTTLTGLTSAFEFVQRDFINIVIDGERAAVHSRVKLRFIPKDRTVTTDLLDLWKFENGKVVELVEFADTAMINDLMR